MNAGLVALAANLAVALAVTLAGPRDADPRPDAEVLAHDPVGEEDESLDAARAARSASDHRV